MLADVVIAVQRPAEHGHRSLASGMTFAATASLLDLGSICNGELVLRFSWPSPPPSMPDAAHCHSSPPSTTMLANSVIPIIHEYFRELRTTVSRRPRHPKPPPEGHLQPGSRRYSANPL